MSCPQCPCHERKGCNCGYTHPGDEKYCYTTFGGCGHRHESESPLPYDPEGI